MVAEKDEIINAIQNGLFNEGIYRITEDALSISESILPAFTKAEEENKTEYITSDSATKAEETAISKPEIKPAAEPGQISSNPKIPEFFGGNKKRVCILVNYRDERWIYFKDKIILEKILDSVKLKFDDVALINTYYYKPASVDELSDLLGISKIIGFDINDPFAKGLKRDEPEKSTNAAVFLINSDLNEIAMNVTQKRLLWNNLKLMFNIK